MLLNPAAIASLAHLVLVLMLGARVLLRPYREPASRIAWIVVIVALPFVGVVAYILFGEVNIGRGRVERMRAVTRELQTTTDISRTDLASFRAAGPAAYRHLFRVGHSISGLSPVTGNSGRLLADSNATIDAIVADIDHARDHVHLLFYIWLDDHNGCKVINALTRAAARGVACRVMADGLGSRAMIRSRHWPAMANAGVRVAEALPIGNPLLRLFTGRIDLRNHRKIVVIDHHITYCGSQNCADPEFRVKPRFAPWVDAVMRLEGPIARQNQFLFACDWMSHVDEDISGLLQSCAEPRPGGVVAQVIGTGPTVRFSAMPELFESIMHTARRELLISTPYFVPSESMMSALCATAYRGVATTIIFPARNDSLIVAAASRSYYAALLDAGVRIFEYQGGLLHTKSLTMDGELTLIGSANMDRRSFDLNYENNILLVDRQLTADMYQRQQHYIARSTEIGGHDVAGWSTSRRLWNNAVAMFGPVL